MLLIQDLLLLLNKQQSNSLDKQIVCMNDCRSILLFESNSATLMSRMAGTQANAGWLRLQELLLATSVASRLVSGWWWRRRRCHRSVRLGLNLLLCLFLFTCLYLFSLFLADFLLILLASSLTFFFSFFCFLYFRNMRQAETCGTYSLICFG